MSLLLKPQVDISLLMPEESLALALFISALSVAPVHPQCAGFSSNFLSLSYISILFNVLLFL